MKRISLLRITFIVMASFFAQDLQASTANDIYNRSSHNVLVLEGLDAQGKIQLQASATSLGNDVAVTQCDLLSGADKWVVIQDRHVFSAYPRQRDESRNLCRLDVPGLRTANSTSSPLKRYASDSASMPSATLWDWGLAYLKAWCQASVTLVASLGYRPQPPLLRDPRGAPCLTRMVACWA